MEMREGSIQIAEHGNVTVVSLVGDHDVSTADDVRGVLVDRAATADGVVVSLMETEFFDSGIVHALFTADRTLHRRGRSLVLHVATASIVQRVLDVSGLKGQMRCTGSLTEAIALASQAVERPEWSTT